MSKEKRKSSKGAYACVKRFLDVFFALALLAFLWLPMLIIAVAVRADSPGKAIFRQIRVGRDGRLFVCYKFRTMYTSAPPCCPSSKFCDAHKYITPIGRFLRRASLDELPQLFNVVKGDMSIVGPRPLIIAEFNVHKKRTQNGVYILRPGITGLSQICGRDRVTDERKIELDTQYLKSFGFLQDVKIVGKTLGRVITGDGMQKSEKSKGGL